jgi:excisionase family DNA binding protein
MTAKAAADRLGISLSLLYKLLAAGKIAHERHGVGSRPRIVIREDALEAYRKECTREGRANEPLPLKHITLQ